MSNSNNNRKTIDELEAEILNSTPLKNNQKNFTQIITSVQNWFFTLPSAGKIVVGLFGVMISFSLLRTVLSIVQLVFSLLILGGIFYILFEFVFKQKK